MYTLCYVIVPFNMNQNKMYSVVYSWQIQTNYIIISIYLLSFLVIYWFQFLFTHDFNWNTNKIPEAVHITWKYLPKIPLKWCVWGKHTKTSRQQFSFALKSDFFRFAWFSAILVIEIRIFVLQSEVTTARDLIEIPTRVRSKQRIEQEHIVNI